MARRTLFSRIIAFGAVLIVAGAPGASCQRPAEPSVDIGAPVDAEKLVKSIQRETARSAQQISEVARSEAVRERANVAKALSQEITAENSSAANPGRPAAPEGNGNSSVSGRLEQADKKRLIIRDDSGFEYWLQTDNTTRVTVNGRPAQLEDFKQGTEVRASFVWQGNDRVATNVEVVKPAS